MNPRTLDDDGFVPDEEDDGFVPDDEPKKEIHGSGSTFGINALDSASIVGVPAVIGMKDALFGEESAKASKRTDDDDPRFKEKGLLDRYRSNKEWLKKGMGRAADESPVAALGGQFAPILIPGQNPTKGLSLLPSMMKRGAAVGGLHGLLGGDADTAGGDIKDTLIDTAAGAAGGALGEGAGSAGGKFVKWMGKKAGTKLEEGISSRAASLLGKYGKKKGEVAGARRILRNEAVLEQQVGTKTPGLAERQYNRLKSQFPAVDRAGSNAERANARRVFRRQQGSIKRFGGDGDPSKAYAREVANRNMLSQSKAQIKDLLGLGVRAGVGAAVGGAVGNAIDSPRGAYYGAAIGGASGGYIARKLAKNVMEHPVILYRMGSKLPAFGERMARLGGASGATAGYLTALLATKQGRQALEAAVSEDDAESGDGFEEMAGEGDGQGKVDLNALEPTDEDRKGKLLENYEDDDEKKRKRTAPIGGDL